MNALKNNFEIMRFGTFSMHLSKCPNMLEVIFILMILMVLKQNKQMLE